MNYRYDISGVKHILTEAEHKAVSAQIGTKENNTLIKLRNGKLIINLSFIRSVSATNESVNSDEAERREIPQTPNYLSEEKKPRYLGSGSNGFKAMSSEAFIEKMGWERDANGHIVIKK